MTLEFRAIAANDIQSTDLHAIVVSESQLKDRAGVSVADEIAARLESESSSQRFKAELGSSVMVSGDGTARWTALVGAGSADVATDHHRVGAAICRLARQINARSVTISGVTDPDAARFVAEGLALADYRFDRHLKKDEEAVRLESVRFAGGSGIEGALTAAQDQVAGISLARDVANESPNLMTPTALAAEASSVAERHGLECTIYDDAAIDEKGFRLLAAVGRGSSEESRMIHLVYRGGGETRRRIALVGKGITFDTGGYSLKVGDHQMNMHLDMGGAAAVLGAAEIVGRMKPEGVEVHFIIPAAENCVSGNAYKVMDIIRSYSGVSVEIHNTDAEGRLVLADGIALAAEQKPDEIIDIATLTGSCVVALGTETAGVFTPDDGLAERILAAASAADEAVWRLPLSERIEKQLKSDRADVKNVGARWGGAISAALFLKRFAGDCTWAHIDIAGPAMTDEPWEHINKGGTGFGAALLAEHIRRAGQA